MIEGCKPGWPQSSRKSRLDWGPVVQKTTQTLRIRSGEKKPRKKVYDDPPRNAGWSSSLYEPFRYLAGQCPTLDSLRLL
jgi:hypothetical protein